MHITAENVQTCVDPMVTCHEEICDAHRRHRLRSQSPHRPARTMPHFRFRRFDNVNTYRIFFEALARNIAMVANEMVIEETVDATTLPFWHALCNSFQEDQINQIEIICENGSALETLESPQFSLVLEQIASITKESINVTAKDCRMSVLSVLRGLGAACANSPTKPPSVYLSGVSPEFFAQPAPFDVFAAITSVNVNGGSFSIPKDLGALVTILGIPNPQLACMKMSLHGELNEQQKQDLIQALYDTKIGVFNFLIHDSGDGTEKVDFWDCFFASLQGPNGCPIKTLSMMQYAGQPDILLKRFVQYLPSMKKLTSFITFNQMDDGLRDLFLEALAKNTSLAIVYVPENVRAGSAPFTQRNELYQKAEKFVASVSPPGTAALAIAKLGQVGAGRAAENGASAIYTVVKSLNYNV